MTTNNTSLPIQASDLVFNLTPGDVVRIPGQQIRFEAELGDGLLHFKDTKTGGPVQFRSPITGELALPDTAWWMDLLRSGDYQILSSASEIKLPPRVAGLDHDDIKLLDEKAELRRFVIDQLLKRHASYSDPDVSRHLDEIWQTEKEKVEAKKWARPATGSARRWYRKFADFFQVRLVDTMSKSGRVARCPSAQTMDPVARRFVEDAARYYYTRDGYKIADAWAYCHKLIKAENSRREEEGGLLPVLKLPSYSTVGRAIKRIRCYDTLAEKKGKAWAKRYYKVSGPGLYTQVALQIAIADDKFWDSFVVIDADNRLLAGRPTLCVLMDLHTRCIIGWRLFFQKPSTHTAVETIKHECRPKESTNFSRDYPTLDAIGGVPSQIIADNGTNWVGAGLEDALRDIGTSLGLAATGTPTHKSVLERFFLTLDMLLAAKLPGYAADPELAPDFGNGPERRPILTKREVEALITQAVCVYHITSHSTIGMPPVLAWEISARKKKPSFLQDPRKLDHLLGTTKRLRLTTNGVSIEGISYRDQKHTFEVLNDASGIQKAGDRLPSRAAAWVKVRFNEEDLTHIHVWNERNNEYVTLPAINQRYVEGLSLFQHRQIKAWAKREGRAFSTQAQQLEARQHLNDLIHQLVPKLAYRDRLAAARMLSSERVQGYLSQPPVQVVDVEPTAEGNAKILEVSAGVELREDRGMMSPRPPIGETEPAPATPLDNSIEAAGSGQYDHWDFDDGFNAEGDA